MNGWWLAAFLALWLLFLALTAVVVSMVRNVGVLTERVHRGGASAAPVSSFSTGQTVPTITVTDRAGTPTTLRWNATTVVAVVSPHCAPCRDLLHHLATTTDPLHPTATHTLLSIGTAADLRVLVEDAHGPNHYSVYVDEHGVVAREWGITATPTILVIDSDGHLQHQQAGWIPPSATGEHR